jgi:preprotein translocase subunit SecF
MSAAEPKTNIDFMGKRKLTLVFSLFIIFFCGYEWFSSGSEKFGIDFLGGIELVVGFDDHVSIGTIRTTLESAGVAGASVQSFEKDSNEFSIRMKGSEESGSAIKVKNALSSIEVEYTLLREDFVGPLIGDKIKSDGFKAIFFAMLILLAYVTWKFEFSFALGAIAALVHDVLMAAGIFIFLGGEIGASALAAFLTILGYSVNDTIIVFDRIRENLFLKIRAKSESKIGSILLKKLTLPELINLSINQTLSRTALTSGTTLFTCFSLWYFGGGAISDLALILIIGIITGTYSSIFIAPMIILALEKKNNQKI